MPKCSKCGAIKGDTDIKDGACIEKCPEPIEVTNTQTTAKKKKAFGIGGVFGYKNSNISISTTDTIGNKVITKNLGLVFSIQSRIGGLSVNKILEETCESAITEMEKECIDMGGNAIIGFRSNTDDGAMYFYGSVVVTE